MSQFIYNNVEFQLIKTNSVERIANWSDDDTEYKWSDFYISLTASYNPAATSYVTGGQFPGSMPPITDTAIRNLLMQPRRSLFFAEAGYAILNIPVSNPDGSAIDCDNGPIPISCNISRIAAPRLFYIIYTIKCSIIECPAGSVPSPIASSRYSRTEGINDQWLSVLTTSGITYFRSNVLAAMGTTADQYRNYLVPQQLLGYQRTDVSFAISSDGLRIDWSVTDTEKIQDLGAFQNAGTAGSVGITKMGLTYHVGQLMKSNLGLASFGSVCTVNIWAESQKGSNRYSVLIFMFSIVLDKLINIIPIGIMSSAEITEDVFSNRCQMNLSYIVLDDAAGFPELAMPITGVVANPIIHLPSLGGENPQLPFADGTRGTAAYYLAVSSFAVSCYTAYGSVGIDASGTLIPNNVYDNNPQYGQGPTINGYYLPVVPSSEQYPIQQSVRQSGLQSRGIAPEGDESVKKAMYVKYEVISNFVTSKGIITLPKATPSCSTDPNNPDYSPDCKPESCVNIQLFQPVTRNIVEFAIDRIGALPEIPSPVISQFLSDGTTPNPYYGNFTLLNPTVSPIGMEIMPNGYTPIYRVTGVYTYSCLKPLDDAANVPFPIPPWVNIRSSQTTQIISSDYEQGIINNLQS